VILLYIAFKTITSSATGGLDEMYRLLTENAIANPIEGNAQGSYLTMSSLAGFEFGILVHTGTLLNLAKLIRPWADKGRSADFVCQHGLGRARRKPPYAKRGR
jgi:hypothetical protein